MNLTWEDNVPNQINVAWILVCGIFMKGIMSLLAHQSHNM
jgi:hypothetical protein